jgi:hypothetical protein
VKAAKQIFPFFLLAIVILITARFAVFSGYLHSQKIELRKTSLVQQNLKVKKIIFSKEDLFEDRAEYEWKEHNKELVISGSYHEVLSVQKIGESFVVSVIEDKTENELLKGFFEKNTSAQETANNLLYVLQMQYPAPNKLTLKVPPINFYSFQQLSKPALCLGFSSSPFLPPRAS